MKVDVRDSTKVQRFFVALLLARAFNGACCDDDDVKNTLHMYFSLHFVYLCLLDSARYQSMFMGTFNNFKLIQNLASYHESIPNSVVLLYDPVQTAAGQLTLRAFRLSDDFLELSKR
jgi:translation initiation factor 3 subunit H